MVGTAAIIKLINRDELIHCTLFENIIRETFDIQKEKELIYSMFNEAVKQDINWSTHIIGDNILGFNSKSLENYIKYIANRRLKYLGLDPLYDNPVNQFKHLERTADLLGEGFVKANYFETSVTAYNMASSINDWDKI
jgi:ribonucleoside-diphosphate reductase beta chain